MVGVLALLPSLAWAQQGPGYIYSYEQLQLGDTAQWVLVPKALPNNLIGDLESDVRAAVSALQKAKRPTYGRTTVTVEPKALAQGKVTINVDEDKIKYQLIIEAEVVTTLAGLGITEVTFESDTTRVVRPEEIPFASFTPTLPLWRALPPAKLKQGLVLMPDGSYMDVTAFQAAVKKGDREVLDAVYASMLVDAPLAQIGTIERLTELKPKGWEDAVSGCLQKDSSDVRIAAIDALRGSKDKKVLEALSKVVDKDSNPDVQAAAASCLSASDNKKYSVYGAYHTLRGDDANAAVAAIDELVKKKITDAVPELVTALSHPATSVGRRAATAIRELGDDKALLKALSNEELRPEIREQLGIEVSLLKSKDDRYIGLAYVAAKGTETHALEAIAQLGKLRDPEPYPALEAALQSTTPEVRLAAAAQLADLKAVDSVLKLMEAARTYPDEAFEIEQSVVRLLASAEKLSELEERLEGRNSPLLKRSVYMALGQRAVDGNAFNRVRETLTQGLQDPEPVARGGAILALASATNPDDLLVLSPLSRDDDANVRVDVARALSLYPAGQAQDALLKLLGDDSEDVVVAAVKAFGKRKETAVLRDLMKMQKHPSKRVRIALLKAVAAVVDDETRADGLPWIANALFDSDVEVKSAAIKVLGGFNDAQAVESLALLVRDPNKTIQHATLRALGATQHPDAISLLAEGLKAADAPTRRVALEALQVHANPAVQVEIEQFLTTEADTELKKLAQSILEALRS